MVPTGALFTREGEHFVPTDRARGPWSPDALHGSPVAALIAFCVEQRLHELGKQPARQPGVQAGAQGGAQGELRIARQTIDLFRPVPYGELQVDVDTIRQGRRLAVFQTLVRCEGKLLTQATTLCLRSDASLGSVGADHTADAPEPPEAAIPNRVDRVGNGWVSYPGTLEMRHVVPPGGQDAPVVWIRADAPVLADAPLTPAVRAASIADFVSPFANMQPGTQRLCERRHHIAPTSSANQRMELPAYRLARGGQWSGNGASCAGRHDGRVWRLLGRQPD